MARDYKSRAQRRKSKQPVSIWRWLLIGYIAGVLTVGLVWIKLAPGTSPGNSWIGDRPPVTARTTPTISQPEEDEVEQPQFDFYSLLPQMEVVVPDDELEDELSARKPPESNKPQQQTEPSLAYLIQVGSFRNGKDADRVRAKLTLLGMNAKVSKVSSKGVTWHRVRVGPLSSNTTIKNTRKQLADNGYKTLVLRYKP